eukprot:5984240-Prymnesium_polylepis.1
MREERRITRRMRHAQRVQSGCDILYGLASWVYGVKNTVHFAPMGTMRRTGRRDAGEQKRAPSAVKGSSEGQQ